MSDRPNPLRWIAYPFLPAVDTARGYSLAKLRADALAGLTVAVVEVPQAMAYAYIAGVPPQYGLYTSIIQGFIGALLASNNHLASGPTNTQSLLIAAIVSRLVAPGNPQVYLQLTIGLGLVKGFVQLAFAAARMGNLVRYVSESVIIGFTAGAGILIAVGQVGNFLGLPPNGAEHTLPGVLGTIQQLAPRLDLANLRSVLLGLAALGVLVVAPRVWRLLPGPLLAIVVTATAVAMAGWDVGHLPLVGQLPPPSSELFTPQAPQLNFKQVEGLLAGAVALALLGMIETVAIGKAIASRSGERVSPNREFFAQGAANVIGSFLNNIPGSGSFTRSALNYTAGGRTRFAGIFNSLIVLLIFVAFAPQAAYIPLSSLAAILFVVAYGLVDWRAMVRIARTQRSDAVVCLASLLGALVLPLQYAIYLGVFLNIALYVRRASQLHIAEMVRTSAGPFIERPLRAARGNQRVVFLQVEGDLFFGVADELAEALRSVTASGAKIIIMRLKRTHSIDATVMLVLERFTRELQRRGGHVILCGVREGIMLHLLNFGLLEVIGRPNVFEASFGVFTSAKRAIERARVLAADSLDVSGLDLGDETEAWAYEI